jgi:D-glycero-alpha-D-manno-heptose-7-phosphate kinase
MKTVKARSPVRVDLAGGTLDFWPLYSFLGTCTTVNVAVHILTSAKIVERSDRKLVVKIKDLQYEGEFASLADFMKCEDPELKLVQAHVQFWNPGRGFELTTESESPVGGGLGGSSSLSISLIKAFSAWLNRPVNDEDTVRLASNLEAKVLHVPTGTQDYYPAIYGGLNIIDFTPMRPQWQALSTQASGFADLWNKRALLVYTGQPHQSGINNWEVFKATVQKDAKTLKQMKRLQEISSRMRDCVMQANWMALPTLFNEEYEARVSLSEFFAAPTIHRLQEVAIGAGAESVKICGAGGGGCVLVWTTPTTRDTVKEACQKSGFKVLQEATPVDARKSWVEVYDQDGRSRPLDV